MRLLAWTAVVVAVAFVGATLTGYLKYRSVYNSIQRVAVPRAELGKRPPKYTGALNILLIGSDSRTGRDRQFGESVQGQRSDTIMLLHLVPGRRGAVVVSIPRDTVVPVLPCRPTPHSPGQVSPGQDHAGLGSPGQQGAAGPVEQINGSFAAGGPACLWKTVEHVTGIHIDHFVELNFTGFEKVIDDIGGVNICLPRAVNDPLSKLRLSRGRHHVGGAQALAFWRARYIGEGSDLQRIQRDQFLMAALLQGIKHSDLLGSPARIYSVVTDVAAATTTDIRDVDTMIKIANSVRAVTAGSVQFVQVPSVPYPANQNWVQWQQPQARALFTAIAHDRTPPQPGASARPVATHPPGPGHATTPAAPGAADQARPPGASGSPAPSGPANPGHLARNYGGITGSANVCQDSRAFAGPDGS